MSIKEIGLIMLGLLFALNSQAWAQTGGGPKNPLRKNEPIQIVSDKMEAFQASRMVVFSGNAVAQQGDVRIQADRLSIYKDSGDSKEKKVVPGMEQAGDLEKIVQAAMW